MNNKTPALSNVLVLKQILNLIPRGMISRHALETGVEGKARTFSVLSHFSAMLFAQLSHAIGLNDVCDWLRLKSAALTVIKDQIIVLKGKHKGMQVRRVEAWVEVDEEWRVMVFLTNNFVWIPSSVCDLYRRRWDIEVIFKQVK